MKYSINDRVAVYENGVRFIGNVTKILEDKIEVWIVDTSGICKAFVYVHEKQIRKIKPKKKAREFWIKLGRNDFKYNTENIKINGTYSTIINVIAPEVLTEKPVDEKDYIHVKEVLK